MSFVVQAALVARGHTLRQQRRRGARGTNGRATGLAGFAPAVPGFPARSVRSALRLDRQSFVPVRLSTTVVVHHPSKRCVYGPAVALDGTCGGGLGLHYGQGSRCAPSSCHASFPGPVSYKADTSAVTSRPRTVRFFRRAGTALPVGTERSFRVSGDGRGVQGSQAARGASLARGDDTAVAIVVDGTNTGGPDRGGAPRAAWDLAAEAQRDAGPAADTRPELDLAPANRDAQLPAQGRGHGRGGPVVRASEASSIVCGLRSTLDALVAYVRRLIPDASLGVVHSCRGWARPVVVCGVWPCSFALTPFLQTLCDRVQIVTQPPLRLATLSVAPMHRWRCCLPFPSTWVLTHLLFLLWLTLAVCCPISELAGEVG